MADLNGKAVLVTGGARRLGKAICLALARAGARVAFTYLASEEDARKTLQEIEHAGAKCVAVSCDVRDEISIQRALHSVLKELGRLDVLVNNAGFYETVAFDDLTQEKWDNVFAVNVRGPFLVSKACTATLRQNQGRIIHMGSLGGEKPWATHAHYCSSKAALHMLTRTMAKALAPEIAVNCVAPGVIEMKSEGAGAALGGFVEKTPMRRNGTSADVVSAVMYFATAPHFVTGQILTVDGGLGLN
ncbi:MAG TPA: SDR family oxidoreductase [Alphaproteobacteria bacterium]|nr:SDR family oxidoreductase [Alphaproteobacteria bacterium]